MRHENMTRLVRDTHTEWCADRAMLDTLTSKNPSTSRGTVRSRHLLAIFAM